MPFLGESSILFGGFTGPTAGYVPAGAIWLDGVADGLSKTWGSAPTSSTTMTVSWWDKRAKLSSSDLAVMATGPATVEDYFRYDAGNQLQTGLQNTSSGEFTLSKLFRDTSAWMHHVMAFDTSNGTQSLRIRHWTNGVEDTATNFDTPALSYSLKFLANGDTVYIGWDGTSKYNGCYFAEFICLDGVAVTDALDFGKYDTNGNWVPIDPTDFVTANKGTNGFWLDFADSADLGNDVSGNGNDFTPISMSAANSTSDRPADKATDSLGNYNTVSTLFTREVNSYSSPAGSITTSNGNLTVDFQTGGTNPLCITTQVLQPGKKYHFEWTTDVWGSDALTYVAVWLFPEKALKNTTDINTAGVYHYGIYTWNPSRGVGSSTNFNGSSLTSISASDAWGVGEVLSLDIDMSTVGSTTVVAKLDGVTLATDSSLAFLDEPYVICPQVQSNGANRTWKGTFNFGASAFATTPLTDHVGVYTSILPAPTVTDPSAYFKAVTYTGTGSARSVTGVGFQPDFVWVKNRDAADSHVITDVIRGVQAGIFPDATAPEYSDANYLTSFDSDGFSVGTQDAFNALGENIVAWCLKAGGAGSSNTNGSITSTVSVAAHGGFSIGTYTGTGANATVGHGLSSNPDFFIIKCIDQAYSWACWHKDLTPGDYLVRFDSPGVEASQAGGAWQSNPIATSGVITLGPQTGQNSVDEHVFYAFARVPGLIGIGSYRGNGSADGPYVVVDDGGSGFRPAFLLIKNIDDIRDWQIYDNRRPGYNGDGANAKTLQIPTLTETNRTVDFTANGFKVRVSAQELNNSGNRLIYLAFAEFPFGGEGISQARAR